VSELATFIHPLYGIARLVFVVARFAEERLGRLHDATAPKEV